MWKELTLSQVAIVLMVFLGATTTDAHPICIDSTFPYKRANGTFTKCPAWNTGKTCVGPANEATDVVEPTYSEAQPPAAACENQLRRISCAVVDPWSGHLFRAEGPGDHLEAPMLCPDYCAQLYSNCANTQMSHSPFVDDSTSLTTIKTLYHNQTAFCSKFASTEYCFKGEPFTVPPPEKFVPGFSLCMERVVEAGGEPKMNLQPVPGHPNLMMVGDLQGLIRIYSVNNSVTGTRFTLVGPLLDIRSQIEYGGEMGLLGVALHKNFFTNGRFYVSYSCGNGGISCNWGDSVVEEYRVMRPSNASELRANTTTRRRIFRVDQPYSNHNGGGLLFSPDPADPHLYLMLGDGGSGGDPDNRAILRIDVDSTFASGGLGGVPADNPFVGVPGAKELIWANGLRNPWRCSFDKETYLMYCGDVGQNRVEEIDIIAKGANYGWRKFEGPRSFSPGTALQGNPVHTPPIISYDHSEVSNSGFASVTGGYVVRSNRDSRMTGKYIFSDLAGPVFLAQESPPNSGQWSRAMVGVRCSASSPFDCTSGKGAIYSFGEMINGDILFGDDSGGVFRFVESSNCANSPPPKACRRLTRRLCRRRADCRIAGGRCTPRLKQG